MSKFSKLKEKLIKFKNSRIGGGVCRLLVSLLMLSIAGGIGAFIAVGEVKGGPKVFADKYFSFFANSNWYSMYNNTDIEESDFINRKTFAKAMSQYALPGEVTEYEISVEDKNSETATVKAEYTMKVYPDVESEDFMMETGSWTMKLKRQPENILLFYTTWKGSVDDYIIEDCQIILPEYAGAKLDGIALNDYLDSVDEDAGLATYKIDRVFMGEHILEVTDDNIESSIFEFIWSDDEDTYTVEEENLSVKEEYRNAASEKSQELLLQCYTTVLTQGTFDEIKPLLAEGEEIYTNAEQKIEALRSEAIRDDGAYIINIQIVGIESEISSYKYMEHLEMKVRYEAEYTAKTGRTVINGQRTTYEGKNTGEATIIFDYINGEWQLVDFNIPCVDYSVKNQD